MDDNKQSKIRMLDRGRFISKHNGGSVYHDSRHRIHQTKLSGGFIGELVQELQLDGSFRDQLLIIRKPEGETCLIEYFNRS
ncbi:MAG: hypothetical protein JO170_00305 [Verrucomicrobia bacterium]|nr:hypothetical protein [Verrucomicrobiota bacterium]